MLQYFKKHEYLEFITFPYFVTYVTHQSCNANLHFSVQFPRISLGDPEDLQQYFYIDKELSKVVTTRL